jgi:hypothetical protein
MSKPETPKGLTPFIAPNGKPAAPVTPPRPPAKPPTKPPAAGSRSGK